jgi:uncharacterized protein HemX
LYLILTTNRGNSTAYEALYKEPEKTTSEKWEALPAGTKTGIYAGGIGAAAIGLGALGFYFWRQRAAGASEAKMASDKAAAENHDLMSYRAGEDTTNQGFEYSAAKYSKVPAQDAA